MTLIASNPVAIGASSGGFTTVWSISDQDVVLGSGGTGPAAMVWQNGQTTLLPAISGDPSGFAAGINDQGQIAGFSYTANTYHAILWQNGVATALPSLGASSRIYAIDDQGDLVGSAEDGNGRAVAVEIRNGVVTQLGTLPGGYLDIPTFADSRAFSINDAGQAVGLSMTASGVQHAVVWQNGTVTDLGAIAGGGQSVAYKINDGGAIVGFATDAAGIDHAALWQYGAMTILPDLQSGGHSIAYDVNDAGLAVGFADLYAGGGWQHHAVLWENGALIDLNTLLPANSGWVLNYAKGITDNDEVAGLGTLNGVSTAFVLSLGDSAAPSVTAAAALQAFQAAPYGQAISVLDSAADIQSDLDGLESIAAAGKLLRLQLSDAGTPTLMVSGSRATADAAALAALSGNFKLDIEGATVNDALAFLQQHHGAEVGIADSSFMVSVNLDQLQAWAAAGQLGSITFTDSQTPLLDVTAQQVLNDQQALQAIQGKYELQISGVTVAQALAFSTQYPLGIAFIADSIDNAANAAAQLQAMNGGFTLQLSGSVADLAAHFDALAALTRATLITTTVTDTSYATLSITAAQERANFGLIAGLGGNVILAVDASQPGADIDGSGILPTVAVFPNPAADYAISRSSDGFVTVTDTAAGTSNSLFQVTALQFDDGTDFVVQAPSATGVTSGNVAELYAAVLARAPDVPGLAYYQQLIEKGQAPSQLQLAEYFLSSPEYQNNPGHAYAQGADGDAKFITDTYQNLLHRAPDSGAVAFYQGVIAQLTNGLTAGTAAYAAAEMQGHAQVLVYFSASAEFLNDVQITAQHPADAAHWLYVA